MAESAGPSPVWLVALVAGVVVATGVGGGGVVLGAAATMVAAADAGVVPGVDAVGVVIV